MNLKNYTMEIFDIAKENNADIGVGKDMFLANLEHRKASYPGADHLDYAALGAEWAAMSDEEKGEQREFYRKLTAVTAAGGEYKALCEAHATGDRAALEAIVEGFEAPAEDEE